MVAKRQKKNRIDLGVNLILSRRDEIEIAYGARQDGNWAIGGRRLRKQ
jgi:hypothetical protein